MQERLVRGWTVQGRTICGHGSGPQARSPIGSVSDGFSYISLSFDESILGLASSTLWVTWCNLLDLLCADLIMVLTTTCSKQVGRLRLPGKPIRFARPGTPGHHAIAPL